MLEVCWLGGVICSVKLPRLSELPSVCYVGSADSLSQSCARGGKGGGVARGDCLLTCATATLS